MTNNFIVATNRYQQRIVLDPTDLIGKGIMKDGLYDRTGLYFIEKILAVLNHPIAFDVGANIGNHALRMGTYCSKVHLFEPQADIVAHLTRTMHLNQITNWRIHHYGLSHEEASLTLYKNDDGCNGETSYVPDLKGRNFRTEKSQVYIGDHIVEQEKITRLDFIKIDVEGFEANVIAGLKNTIRQFKPIIFMEWDKAITKQLFKEHQLFETIFQDYKIAAIIRNPAESNALKKLHSRVKNIINKNFQRKKSIIGEFIPANDYRHIVLIPNDKIQILKIFD